jgi:hypothetical protein
VNNEAGRQKNQAGCRLYLFPPPELALQAQNPGKSRKKIKKAVRLTPPTKQKEPAQPACPIMINYQQL